MKNRIAIKVTFIYFLIGFLWILFSDQLIYKLAETSDVITTIQTYKGWFFVSVTSILLYFLIRMELRKKNEIESDLVKAKIKAEESDHLKSAFLSNMSHEIRTPLNGILGFCELLIDDSFKEDDKQIFAKNLTQNGNDLLKLINDILDISRIQENQFEIAKKNFYLNSLLDHIYHEYMSYGFKIDGKTIDFRVIKGSQNEEIELYSDPVRLTHIFHKLLNNSFFFTTEGFIHFGYTNSENGIEFFVEDSGCGIEENNQEYLFKPFHKGKNQVIGNKGFGLGLAISKGLTNLLGGDLKFTSTPGKGSKFYFSLEKGKIAPAPLIRGSVQL
jgi:signal transduction histidine kinase